MVALVIIISSACMSARVGCGGMFTARSGVLMSPYFPHAYPAHTDCVWHITVADRHQVVLTFDQFDLENATNCRFDYVAVSTICVISVVVVTFISAPTRPGKLVAWHSGRTSVSGRRTFPVLRSTCS